MKTNEFKSGQCLIWQNGGSIEVIKLTHFGKDRWEDEAWHYKLLWSNHHVPRDERSFWLDGNFSDMLRPLSLLEAVLYDVY